MTNKLLGIDGKERKSDEPSQLVLTFDHHTMKLNIDGNVQDIDIAMNMLQSALRYFDVQYRIAYGLQAQQKANQATQDLNTALHLLHQRQQ